MIFIQIARVWRNKDPAFALKYTAWRLYYYFVVHPRFH